MTSLLPIQLPRDKQAVAQQFVLHRLPHHPQTVSPGAQPPKALPSWLYFVNSGHQEVVPGLETLMGEGGPALGL